MIYTTLNRIRAEHPCRIGWEKLLRGLGKTAADNEPLGFDSILRINGADDAFWCLRAEPQHDRLWRMLTVRCARTVQHLMTDSRSLAALDVGERHAWGMASDDELEAAREAAGAAARDAAGAAGAAWAAWAAAGAAAREAAGAAGAAWAAWAAAGAAARASRAAAGAQCEDILMDAVSSFHADPGALGVLLAAPDAQKEAP